MNLYELSQSGMLTKAMLVLLVLFGVALVLTKLVFAAVLIGLSIAVSIFAGMARLKSIGIELATFATVLIGIAYSPMIAAVIGTILIIFHLAATQRFGAYIAWVIPEYFVAGLLTGVFTGSVVMVGLQIMVFMNAVNLFFTALTYRQNLPVFFIHAITSIALNLILFATVGQAMLGWMK